MMFFSSLLLSAQLILFPFGFVGSQVVTSPAIVTPTGWANVTNGASGYQCAYGNSTLVCSDYTAGIYKSIDQGATWTAVSVVAHVTGLGFDPTGGGVFMATANTPSGKLWRSTDNAATWSEPSVQPISSNWRKIKSNGSGTWVAVSSDGPMAVSVDGAGSVWAAASVGVTKTWLGLSYDPIIGKWAASADEQDIATTSNGVTWVDHIGNISPGGFYDIAGGGGQFIAVSYAGSHTIMRSTDGTNWSSITNSLSNNEIYGACYGSTNEFMVTGNNQSAYSSDGGVTFSNISPTNSRNYNACAKGSSKWIMVSGNGSGGQLSTP